MAALAALLLHLVTLSHGFVWDDHPLIENSGYLRTWAGLVEQLRSDFWLVTGTNASGFWRPLISLSYAMDGAIGQWRPWVFHLMNAVGHAAASGLVALLVMQTGAGVWAAVAAGVWFAAMPAHVESVAWIAGRTDVYCAAFVLLAVWLDRRARAAGRRWPGVGAMVALLLALLSKEAGVMFLGVAAVAEWTERRSARLAARLRWLAPYAALTAVYLVAHAALVRPPAPSPHVDAATRLGGQWAAWTLFPDHVAFLWPGFAHAPGLTVRLPSSALAPPVLAGAAALLAWVGTLVVLVVRRSRFAPPLALFGFAALPPILAMALQGALLHAERFTYLPSAGAAWMLGAGLGGLGARGWARRAGLAAATALVVWSGVVTARVLPAWRDDLALFDLATRAYPGNVMAHLQRARVLTELGREDEAAAALERAAALAPDRPELFAARARLAHRLGDWPRVIAEAARAQALDPALEEPRVLRATALVRLGRAAEAGALLDSLRRARPGDPVLDALWGQCLLVAGRSAEALPWLEGARGAVADDPDVAFALGMARASLGRLDEARDAFARAVAMDPAFYDGWLRLAQASHAIGDADGRDAALARAEALPESRDGRAAALRAHVSAQGPRP